MPGLLFLVTCRHVLRDEVHWLGRDVGDGTHVPQLGQAACENAICTFEAWTRAER